jgi:adenylate cyclase
VIDSPGDNLLAAFNSVVDSLRCAWDIQQELAARNELLPEHRRMNFRIGINLGDIIEQKGKLYGDGVNVAARLESLAEPAGINISGTAYDQVKRKLPYNFHFVGEQEVKNITDPVRVYRVESTTKSIIKSSSKKINQRKLSKRLLALLFIAVGVLLVTAIYYFKVRINDSSLNVQTKSSGTTDRHVTKGASIAVLPFKNLSSDKEQEYFSDGITNDIITDLSRFNELLVIASNTVFSFKGKTLNVKEIGQQLDVKYILEGSVQKVGDRVRINAQLVDTVGGSHIWAERYDREYSDIFKLQAEIVKSIVAALSVNISQAERDRALRKAPENLDAYDYFLRGLAHINTRTREANLLAKEMFEKAIAIDPLYAAAYVGLGRVEDGKVSYGWTEFPLRALDSAFEYGQKALDLDSDNDSAHSLMSSIYAYQNKHDLAIREADQALELNPNNAEAYRRKGWVLLWAGRVDDAVTALKMSLRLNNTSVRNVWWHLGTAFYLKGEYEQALDVLEKGVTKQPEFVGYYIALAATYAQLERVQDAASAAAKVRRLDPFFEVESYGTAFRNTAHRLSIAEGLRKAGL